MLTMLVYADILILGNIENDVVKVTKKLISTEWALLSTTTKLNTYFDETCNKEGNSKSRPQLF